MPQARIRLKAKRGQDAIAEFGYYPTTFRRPAPLPADFGGMVRLMYTKLVTAALGISLLALPALAERTATTKDLDLRVVESDLQPQVRVQDHSNRRMEEYRVNNNLYMIKVTPKSGASYYLVDTDGSVEMEMQRHTPGQDIQVPQWTLSSW